MTKVEQASAKKCIEDLKLVPQMFHATDKDGMVALTEYIMARLTKLQDIVDAQTSVQIPHMLN